MAVKGVRNIQRIFLRFPFRYRRFKQLKNVRENRNHCYKRVPGLFVVSESVVWGHCSKSFELKKRCEDWYEFLPPGALDRTSKACGQAFGRRRRTQEQTHKVPEPSGLRSVAGFWEPVKGTLRRLRWAFRLRSLRTDRRLNRCCTDLPQGQVAGFRRLGVCRNNTGSECRLRIKHCCRTGVIRKKWQESLGIPDKKWWNYV